MEKASGMKKTNAAWSADIFRSGNTFELFIVDEGSRQTIFRSPVDWADASSVINLLRGAFTSFGAPAKLLTDGGTFFASARFGDLMHSCGISHSIAAAGAPDRKGLAERLAKT
jgi:hypothetical protein